jgi:hypothetical protein
MTEFLPELLWRPSPNFSSRRGTHRSSGCCTTARLVTTAPSLRSMVRIEQVECVGALRGPRGRGEATRMVDLANNGWHACTFNRRSIGVEMGGFASRGFDAPLLATSAHVFAFFLLSFTKFPVRHARAGIGLDIASHKDLGPAGGGHHDPSDDPTSCRDLLAWSAMSLVRAISLRRGIHTDPRRRVCFA